MTIISNKRSRRLPKSRYDALKEQFFPEEKKEEDKRIIEEPPKKNKKKDEKPLLDDTIKAIAEKNLKKEDNRQETIRKKSKKKRGKKKEKITKKKIAKWALYLIIGVIIFYSYQELLDKGLALIKSNPTTWAIYQSIEQEVAERTLTGLFYASSLGAIFFISLPVEVIFIYYLGLNYYFVQVITIIIVGNLLGMWFDYLFGWLIGERVLKWFMKEKYSVYKKKIDKLGAFLIIVGNIIPFPIEFFAVFLGAIRYGFYRYTIYTLIGKTIKFLIIYIGYVYFMKFIAPYAANLTVDNFITVIKSAFLN